MSDLKHIQDESTRQRMNEAAEAFVKVMLERDLWRSFWRVEVDGCVFKFKVEGYAKYGTPRRIQRDREMAEAVAEFDAAHTIGEGEHG